MLKKPGNQRMVHWYVLLYPGLRAQLQSSQHTSEVAYTNLHTAVGLGFVSSGFLLTRLLEVLAGVYELYTYSSLDGFESDLVVAFQDQFTVTKPFDVVCGHTCRVVILIIAFAGYDVAEHVLALHVSNDQTLDELSLLSFEFKLLLAFSTVWMFELTPGFDTAASDIEVVDTYN